MNDFLYTVSQRIAAQFSPEKIGVWIVGLLGDLIVAAAIFAAFYLGWRIAQFFLSALLRRYRADRTTASFLETLLKYALLVTAVVHSLSALGINTGAILASLGIAGLTIGFAARDALSNFISGLIIFWDRPFVIGDLVEVEGNYGRVDKITLRSTRVVTSDGRMLAVPNSVVINTTVASYTNFPHLRIDVDVSIGVREDMDRVRELLLEIVRHDNDYLDDPAPRVVITSLNDYNTAIQLQAWLNDERRHLQKKYELRERVYKTLSEAGVDMPLETIALAPLEVRNITTGRRSSPDG